MNHRHFDIAIIGQGITGTLLGHFLEQYGLKVLIIDNCHQGASSMVAAGIVNPITGKHFVKSWKIDELLPAALATYDEVGEKLGIRCYTKANIVRALDTIEQENTWFGRTHDPLYTKYIVPDADVSEMKNHVALPTQYAEITQSFHVHFKDILLSYKAYWQKGNTYIEARFRPEALTISSQGYHYHDCHFDKIAFCEGYQAVNNPFFDKLNLQPAKGEILFVRIPGATFRKMYKHKMFLVHQYDDVYWAGSGYEWKFESDKPTDAGLQSIKVELDKMLAVPYEIIGHIAGVRPATTMRRPIVRKHEIHPGMYLLNGMGTKGASLSPLVTRQLASYIVEGKGELIING